MPAATESRAKAFAGEFLLPGWSPQTSGTGWIDHSRRMDYANAFGDYALFTD